MAKLTDISWEEFENLPLEAKRPYLENGTIPNTPYHTLFAQQFDRGLLERLAALANRIRFMAKSKEGALYLKSLLPHKRASSTSRSRARARSSRISRRARYWGSRLEACAIRRRPPSSRESRTRIRYARFRRTST